MKSNVFFRLSVLLSCIFTLFFASLSPVFAETASELRQRMKDRYEGEDSTGETTLRLQKIRRKKDGSVMVRAERIRKTVRYGKSYGKDKKTVMFFLEPADVRGTAFLSYTYDDENKDNDQWLYLPALKKVKRIASSSKSGSFMGTDFSFVDISQIKPEKYTHRYLQKSDLQTLMKDKSIRKILKKKFGRSKKGFAAAKKWMLKTQLSIVESLPKNKKTLKEEGYSKIIAWVNPETLLTPKVIYFGKNRKAFKVMEGLGSKKIQGIWSVTKMQMENFSKSHRTIIEMDKTQYNTGVKDNYFTQRTLTQGL